MLSQEQQAAVDCTAPRVACLAAPGSGKTRVLVARIVRLLHEGVYPGEILALTFTRKAAREMRERLVAEAGKAAGRVRLSTFHAWAAATLRDFAEQAHLDRQFTIRDDDDKADLVRWVGAELGLPHKSVRRLWEEPEVRQRYRQLLRECGAVDYDGLEEGLLTLLKQDPVRRALWARHAHVLVDEAQDTSRVQQDILAALNPANLFMVGDPGQSIYGFRGAHMSGFLAQIEGWERADLTTNYRSANSIVAAASRLGAAMTTRGLEQVAAREDEGEAKLARWGYREDALESVAASVSSAVEQGVDPSTLAVLSPTWSHLTALSEQLDSEGVPHRIAKRAADLWDSGEARWLASVLRVARCPYDHVSLLQALNHGRVRVPLVAWAKARALAAQGTGITLADAVAQHAPEIVFAAEEAETGEVDACVRELLAVLRADHLDTRADRLDEVAQAAREWQWARGVGWGEWLDWYGVRNVEQDLEPTEAQGVTLATIHGAKGLEWDHVIVLGCDDGALPRPGEPEEQRRLFYVATTRARESVTWVAWSEAPSRFVGEAMGESHRHVHYSDGLGFGDAAACRPNRGTAGMDLSADWNEVTCPECKMSMGGEA